MGFNHSAIEYLLHPSPIYKLVDLSICKEKFNFSKIILGSMPKMSLFQSWLELISNKLMASNVAHKSDPRNGFFHLKCVKCQKLPKYQQHVLAELLCSLDFFIFYFFPCLMCGWCCRSWWWSFLI